MASSLFDLSDKVALVTGGNGGIGLGIAKGLAETGAKIVVAARNESKTRNALAILRDLGTEAQSVTTDVIDESSVTAMVNAAISQFGRIDILINNAGTNIRKMPQEYTIEEWDQIVDINLRGVFLCSKKVYSHMAESGGGKIINIGSMTSIFGSDVAPVYAATKGGLVQFTKSLAVAWAKDNIQVNAILPGWIESELTAPFKDHYPKRFKLVSARIPQGRWGKPYDLAGTAVFLASEASDYVTGATITVDGGYSSF